MEGSFTDWTRLAEQQEARSRDTNADDHCAGMFFDKAVQNRVETDRQGRAVFDNVPYVRILIPGQPGTMPEERATEAHKRRWPKAWAAYEAGREQIDGTPLELWPYLNPAQVAGLKHAGVHSVEQLATVTDGNLPNLGMGALELRERARQFLTPADETEQELRATIADQTKRIAGLEAKLEQMATTRAASTADPASEADEGKPRVEKPRAAKPRRAATAKPRRGGRKVT